MTRSRLSNPCRVVPAVSLRPRRALAVLAAAMLGMLPAPDGRANDWPQWRGPMRNGISSEQNWLVQWPPVTQWTRNVGQGYSSVAVSMGKLYTMGWANNVESVYCLNATNGTQIWKNNYTCGSVSYEGSRCTPTVDGKFVYTFGHEGRLRCVSRTTGALVWGMPLTTGLGSMGWGFSASPLIMGNNIILNAHGGAGIAINKLTRTVTWANAGGDPGYASALPFKWGSQYIAAIFSQSGVYGVNPATGAILWSYSLPSGNIADPVVYGDKIFIANGYGSGGRLLQLKSGTLNQVIWQNAGMANFIASSVAVGDYLYGFNGSPGSGTLKCVSLANGAQMWSTNFPSGGLMAAGDKLICLSANGDLAVLKATPTGVDREGRSVVKIGSGTWWTMPVLANGRIYCRSHEGTLICVRVGAASPAKKVFRIGAASRGADPAGASESACLGRGAGAGAAECLRPEPG